MGEVDLRSVGALRRGADPRGESLFAFGLVERTGEGVLMPARGGEGFGGETPMEVAGAPTVLVAGLRLGLTPDEAGERGSG